MGIQTKSRWPQIALGLGFLFLLFRSFFGVDFTDEGFYASIPYRFLLGDRPFIDENAIHQTAGFLTFPFVWLFVTITGSTTGLILFLRLLFVLLTVVVAVQVYRFFLKRLDSISAALLSCAYVLLTPEIPSLSYNSMAVAFLTLALVSEKVIVRGLVSGLMAVAYPPLVLLTPLILYMSWKEGNGGKKSVLQFSSALTLGLAPILVAAIASGIPAIIESYRDSTAVAPKGGGLEKLWSVFKHLLHNGVTTLFPLFIALGFSRIRRPWAKEVAIGLFVLSLVIRFGSLRIPDLVITLTLLLPAFYLWRWPRDLRTRYGISLMAGFIIAWASTNGGVNFYFGAIPALLIALSALPFSSLATPLLSLLLIMGNLTHVYRDQPVWNLKTLVGHGPHAGLWTTPTKASYAFSLYEATRLADRRAERIVYMNDLPAGFLYSSLRPGICSTWVYTPWTPDQREFRDTYKSCLHEGETTAVIWSKKDVRHQTLRDAKPSTDPFDQWIENCKGETIFEDENVTAFHLNSSCG